MTQVSTVTGMAIEMLVEQDRARKEKYGVSMDRTDLKPGQWLQHSIEEHADALQYQIKLKMELRVMVATAFSAGRTSAMRANGMTEEQEDAAWESDLEKLLKDLLG